METRAEAWRAAFILPRLILRVLARQRETAETFAVAAGEKRLVQLAHLTRRFLRNMKMKNIQTNVASALDAAIVSKKRGVTFVGNPVDTAQALKTPRTAVEPNSTTPSQRIIKRNIRPYFMMGDWRVEFTTDEFFSGVGDGRGA